MLCKDQAIYLDLMHQQQLENEKHNYKLFNFIFQLNLRHFRAFYRIIETIFHSYLDPLDNK